MKTLVLTLLAVASVARSALPASPDLQVELFSHRVVKALTLEATGKAVTLCGAKADGPCLVLPPEKRISCSADWMIHCRFEAAVRSFTLLRVDSVASFRVAPTFANVNEPPQTFLMRKARINPASGRLQIITKVDLESYVSGVLRGEASVLHAPAARQAMAILARTWALRWRGRHSAVGFDFCSLTHCQVFRLPQGGEVKADDGLDAAALATRGQVLRYNGKLADPYFTASCGGMTEAAGNVWPDRAQPYLISVHDPYCLASGHAPWAQRLTAESLQQVLRESLYLPMTVPLTALSVQRRDSSGLATVLRVAAGGVWDIDANKFRYAVDRRQGWQQIKSNLYSIERQGNSWVFSGRGLGHGVGVCQMGAEQMARMGSSTEHILSTYLPGTEIARQSPVDNDPIASSEHFELVYFSFQEPWVKQTLDTLEQWRRELGAHVDILPSRVRVQTWASVADFVRATGEPGWMAAASDGQSISLQPLELLGRKRILSQTLRHELTHLVVHRMAAKGTPRWLEEGSVIYLTGERIETPPSAFKNHRELDETITKPHSEAEMKAAYAQALERVRQFALRHGDAALWRVLEHPTAADLRWLSAMP
jgi:stage II sporulation protein D